LPEEGGRRRGAWRTLDRFTAGARQALQALCVALIGTYAVLVLLQVLFRYVLNQPLFWAEEVIRYGLVWSVLLGSALVAYERGHIRIDILGALLGARARRLLDVLTRTLSWAFLVILLVAGARFVERTLFQSSPSLGVPMWVVYAAVPVGAAIEAWFMLFARAPRETAAQRDVLL
jgi:TRAP-type C4-dicarboxylate transport system permease small subunit